MQTQSFHHDSIDRAHGQSYSGLQRLKLYLDLTRPRVLWLVLFTAPAAFWLDPKQPLLWQQQVATLLSVLVLAAACSVLNAYLERDRDALMVRTRQRPLPAGHLVPRNALLYGMTLCVLALCMLQSVGGWEAFAVGLITVLVYVGMYTVWLKPRSVQNMVVGSLAGAAAPLIADVAAHGKITPAGAILFGIVFFWQPPHFWAIALFRRREYAAAGIPMMPELVGEHGTRLRGLAYTMGLVVASVMPSVLGYLGWGYGIAVLMIDGVFVLAQLRAIRLNTHRADWDVFKVSIVHLFLLFGALYVAIAVR